MLLVLVMVLGFVWRGLGLDVEGPVVAGPFERIMGRWWRTYLLSRAIWGRRRAYRGRCRGGLYFSWCVDDR